ncbi:hypothetical protein V1514DRAFT_355962 [Lipomyces japonicus]|uniref:uncharacterized protein n=1 Tax=Lipomyces japonicus TaxID=56871 RepID=UPI0034CE42E0
MYSFSAGGRHFAFEIALDSETELSTIIATPLKVLPALPALTARYLPTAEELKNYQVLRVSNVPPFEDASRLRDVLKPLFEHYGEILDIKPVFFQNFTIKIKTGEYLVNFKLADLDKSVPNSLECTARNSTFPLTVCLDGKTNFDECYFCHSPRHVRRTCPAAPPCRFCQSRAHFWVRCPQRKEQHPSEAKPQAHSHAHREFTTVSPRRPPPPETTVSKPRWNLGIQDSNVQRATSPGRIERWFAFFQHSPSHIFCLSECSFPSPNHSTNFQDHWLALHPDEGALIAERTSILWKAHPALEYTGIYTQYSHRVITSQTHMAARLAD